MSRPTILMLSSSCGGATGGVGVAVVRTVVAKPLAPVKTMAVTEAVVLTGGVMVTVVWSTAVLVMNTVGAMVMTVRTMTSMVDVMIPLDGAAGAGRVGLAVGNGDVKVAGLPGTVTARFRGSALVTVNVSVVWPFAVSTKVEVLDCVMKTVDVTGFPTVADMVTVVVNVTKTVGSRRLAVACLCLRRPSCFGTGTFPSEPLGKSPLLRVPSPS